MNHWWVVELWVHFVSKQLLRNFCSLRYLCPRLNAKDCLFMVHTGMSNSYCWWKVSACPSGCVTVRMHRHVCPSILPPGLLLVKKKVFCSRWIQQHNQNCGLFCLGSLSQEMEHEMNSVASGRASWVWTVPTQWLELVPGHLFALVIKLFLLVVNECCQHKLQVTTPWGRNPQHICNSGFRYSWQAPSWLQCCSYRFQERKEEARTL